MNVHNYINIHVVECAYSNKYCIYTAYYTDIIILYCFYYHMSRSNRM